MPLFGKKHQDPTPEPAATASTPGVSLVKGGGATVSLAKTEDGVYTLITRWGAKDYDLYALVEHTNGHVEVISCFGTVRHPKRFQTRTSDGAVVHVTGDKTAYGSDEPMEVMHVRLHDDIKTVVPVVYSAKNSGTGSFQEYRVSTYVIPGRHERVPNPAPAGTIQVEASQANRDPNVYTFVPAVIHNGPSGPTLEPVELYSARNSENRPTVKNGKVKMDAGEENSSK